MLFALEIIGYLAGNELLFKTFEMEVSRISEQSGAMLTVADFDIITL